jgi:hypothetical protein
VTVPGMNLLGLAMTVLGPQTVNYYAWVGLVANAVGKEVPSFAAMVTRRGSFQPVARSRLQLLGLDMSQSYATFFGPGAVRTLERDGAPDEFGYSGRRYKALDVVDWLAQDGWTAAVCVDIGPDA